MRIKNRNRSLAKLKENANKRVWHYENAECRPICKQTSGGIEAMLTSNPEYVTCKRCLALLASGGAK